MRKTLKSDTEIMVDCLKAKGGKFALGAIRSSILNVIYGSPEISYIPIQHDIPILCLLPFDFPKEGMLPL